MTIPMARGPESARNYYGFRIRPWFCSRRRRLPSVLDGSWIHSVTHSIFQPIESMLAVLQEVGHSQQYLTSELRQAHAQDPQRT